MSQTQVYMHKGRQFPEMVHEPLNTILNTLKKNSNRLIKSAVLSIFACQ